MPPPSAPRPLLAVLSLPLLAAAACREPARPTPDASTVAPPAPPPRVAVGQPFDVGLMRYQVDRVSAARDLPTRARAVAPPPGSAWVVVEYQRTWRGTNPITVPAMPFELVTRAGQRIPGDVDGLSAHIERTNCGELGPSRLTSLQSERNCEVFAVPLAQLAGATLEPSPAAHRGETFVRPAIELTTLVAPD